MPNLRFVTDWTAVDRVVENFIDVIPITNIQGVSIGELTRQPQGRSEADDAALVLRADPSDLAAAFYTMARQAAAASAPSAKCDENGNLADAVFHLRPNSTPYWRCNHPSGPHCFDSSGNSISPCP